MFGNYWLLNEIAKERQAEILRQAETARLNMLVKKKSKTPANTGRIWLLLKSIF